MKSIVVALALVIGISSAHAKPAPPPVFPVVLGTHFTFVRTDDGSKQAWTTTLLGDDEHVQYDPHADIANWFSKAGFRVEADGVYIQGESMPGDDAPAASRAIAFPLVKGAVGKVPGMINTTYTVGAHAKVKVAAGTFDAWQIAITDSARQTGAAWIAPGVGLIKIQLPSGRVDELSKIDAPH